MRRQPTAEVRQPGRWGVRGDIRFGIAAHWLTALAVCLGAASVLALPPSHADKGTRPPPTRVLRDLAYAPGRGVSHRMDLYVPAIAGSRRLLPVVAWIHGGGWKEGDKRWIPGLSLLLARGYAIASINYRLSPEAVWPAQLEDCRAAIRFIRVAAVRYGLDASRIGVWGESAGGHLASLLGTNAAESETVSSRVQAVCAWSAPSELGSMGILSALLKLQTGEDPVGELLGGPVSHRQKEAAQASPLRHASNDDPPFLLMHGKSDLVVPVNQSEMLAAALQKAGVLVRLHLYESVGHADDFFLKPAQLQEVAAFFDACLLGREGDPATRPGDKAAVTPAGNADRSSCVPR